MDRKINVEAFTEEQLAQASEALGVAIRNEVDATCEKINKLLDRYGLICKMEIVIGKPDELNEQRDKIKSE